MRSSRLQDVSLYELALSSEHPPHPLQVSPTTFKSMVSVVLDLLIDQRITATVWMKLPKGDVWHSELERFRKAATAPYTICAFVGSREEVAELEQRPIGDRLTVTDLHAPLTDSATALDAADLTALIDDQGGIPVPVADCSRTFFLPLSAETQLKREYFLLVLSDEFSGLVLAHRPRSVRHRPEATAPEPAIVLDPKSEASTDEELERKHPLLSLCSLEPQTLQKVLDGIQVAILSSQAETEASEEFNDLMANWEHLIRPVHSGKLNPIVLGQLLAKQVQVQEDVWHSTAIYRRQAETASTLQMENEELQNAIRLKDEFVKNVGQELRTPLATMKTALTLLNSPNLKPVQRQKYMDMLVHECDRQSSLITSVLDLLQLENVDDRTAVQPLRLMDVVPGIVSTYQPLAQEKGVMLAYTIPEDLPAVSCTNAWLRQIVINLLHNGIKFTPSGGRVWVMAKQQGDYVQIEVRDTGVGIAQADIPRVFERFYRVRHGTGDDSSGVGLGLSIVQQLLLRCGGSISVKSKQGEGTTFNVLLPIYPK